MEVAKVNNRPVIFKSLQISNSLMYAIKAISGDSENDIVTYFYNMGISLFNDVIGKRKIPMRCNRTVKILYKNTDLCVKFDVWSTYFSSKHYSYSSEIQLTMSVACIANDYLYINGAKMDAMLAETGLGISSVPVIEARKPEEKKYRCLEKSEPQRSSVSDDDWEQLPAELKAKYEKTT